MGIYQVMRINLLQRENKKKYALLLFLIPLIVLVNTSFLYGLQNQKVVIGVHKNSEIEDLRQKIGVEQVSFYVIDSKCEKADQILKQYDVIYEKENFEQIMSQIKENNRDVKKKDNVSQEKVAISMLMTICMVLGSIYGGIYIKDREHGLLRRFQYGGGEKIQYFMGIFLSVLIKLLVLVVFSIICFRCFEISNHYNLDRMVLQCIMITGISTIFGMAIALIYKKELSANLTATGITAILSIMCGTYIPLNHMPKILQLINQWNPFQWVLQFCN